MTLDFQKYLQMFQEEAREYLYEMQTALRALRENPQSTESWQTLFRHAHSIKGMAASLGLEGIQQLTHAMEDLLGWAQDQPERAAVLDDIEQALEFLQSLIAQANERPPIDVTEVQDHIDRLRARRQTSKTRSPVETPSGGAPPLHRPPTTRVLEGEVEIAEGVSMPAARCLVILERLKTWGSLQTVEPPLAAIAQGRAPRRLFFEITTTQTPEELTTHLRALPDVIRVIVREKRPSVAPEVLSEVTIASTVRVRLDVLDRLFEMAGAMFMQIQRLRHLPISRSVEDEVLLRDSETLARQIYLSLTDLRMLPLAILIEPVRRAADRLAQTMGKRVRVVTRGEDIAVDKTVLEHLLDPFMHMVRNSIDHGIEPPAERVQKGKPEEGYISIHAQRDGEWVRIVFLDDGRGMDVEAIARRALERGLVDRDQLKRMRAEDICWLTTLPGFSTAEVVTEVSGRGVGMDVVRHRVEALGGTLRIETKRNRGTRITLRIPTRLAMLATLVIQHGPYRLALPVDRIHNVLPFRAHRIHYRQEIPVLYVDETIAPILFLEGILGVPSGRPRAQYYMVTIEYEHGRYVLSVPEVVGEYRSIVRRLDPPLTHIPLYSGITVSPSLEVIPLLDVEFIGRYLTPRVD